MQKNCTKNEVNNSNHGKQSKNYKSRLQKYIKQQQKLPGKNAYTTEKILSLLVLDTIKEQEQEEFNSTILNTFQESLWNYQISFQFLKKIYQKNQKIQSILSCLLMVVDGYFEFNSKKICINYIRMPLVMQYQSFFMITSTDNYFILFEVGLHKSVQNLQKQNQGLIAFDILQKITFVDIFFYQKAQEFTDTLQQYQLSIQKDFYRTRFNSLICLSSQLGNQKCYLFERDNKEWPNCIFRPNQENLIQWIPLTFKQQLDNRKNYTVDPYTGKYIEIEFYNKQRQACKNEEIANQNKYQLNFLADFKSAGVIIDILQKAPEFKIKLSNQERDVISTPSNALVIGRSGTGKTTSIVLRIFASETLIKVKAKLNGFKRLSILNDYEGKTVNVRTIFTTANRYLVKEVEKYYKKQELQAQEAINKHRESQTFDFDQSFISETQSEITNFEGDILDYVPTQNIQQIQQQQPDSHQFIKQEIQEVPETQSIAQANYPAFFSTQQLLILLDKQMMYPFFTSQMIEQLIDKIINKVGFLDCDGINLEQHFPDLQYQRDSSNQRSLIVPEVDFLIFYQQFWPTVAQRVKGNQDPMSLPSLVWTQIYSYIKGSQYSYIYPRRCLPFSLYKERVVNYIGEQEIIEIYNYFLKYEEWKAKYIHFDQLDIVNNLLCNIEKGTFKLFPIHYLYIDEVQDLPQALIELFCKITEQGVMFSGDTAQCILKGVGFRFQDLQTLFKNSKKIGVNELEKFQVFQLTTNFRSHNSILQLANCIVTMLELLFPKTIDHLKQEVSNLKGPKPVFFQNSGYRQIFDYLNNYSYAEDICEIEFGYNQVVIVKNQEAKQQLPREFDDALVLTIFQAKGLEFDDVIIYNCFTSDPIPQHQWELLTCIDVKDTFVDSGIFQLNITKHQNNSQDDIDYQKNKEGQIRVPKLLLNNRYEKKQTNDYSSLCNELKALYVCVLVYDDEPEKRCFLENIFKLSDVCDIYPFSPKNKPEQFQRQDYEANYQQQNIYQNFKPIQRIIQQRETTEEERNMWEKQGEQMYQRKYYDEAAKCFRKSKNQQMFLLSKAYSAAAKGSQILAQFNTYQIQFDRFKQYDMKKKMDELEPLFQDSFKQAAVLFQNEMVNDLFQAAQCFYSGQFYLESLKIFLNFNLFPQAAKSAKKLKQWLLAAILNLKQHKLEKCLKLLHENGVDRFFEYEVLKRGYEFKILSEDLIITYLKQQERLSDNIFFQMEQKAKQNRQIVLNPESYALSICPLIPKEINLLEMFNEEIEIILSAQIEIEDDLLEMVFLQIQVFWKCYFKIIDSNSIMNYHKYSKLEKLFENTSPEKSLESQETKEFIIAVLEHLNQFSLLQTLFPDRIFYDKNLKISQCIKPPNLNELFKGKLAELFQENKQIFNELFYNQNFADVMSLFKNCKIKQQDEFQNQEMDEIYQLMYGPIQNINQSDLVIQCNQLFAHFSRLLEASVGNLEKNQKKYIKEIFSDFKQSKALNRALVPQKSIDQYFKEKKEEFQANPNQTCWKFYEVLMKEQFSGDLLKLIISIQEDIFYKEIPPLQDKLRQIFENQDQQIVYVILFNFVNICCQYKEILKKLLFHVTFEQFLKLYKILLQGNQLFQIADDTIEQKLLFKSISPYYKIYMPKASILQIVSHSFIIMSNDCRFLISLKPQNKIQISENLIIGESESIFKLIREEFSNIIEKSNLTKWLFRYVLSQNRFQKSDMHFLVNQKNKQIQIQLSFLLQRALNSLFEKSQKLDQSKLKTVYQIVTIYQTFILAIPPHFTQKIQSTDQTFKYYLSFQVNWKNQLSIESLYDWLSYYKTDNYRIQFQYPHLLMYELNFVILLIILTLRFQNSQEQTGKELNYQLLSLFDEVTKLEALFISNKQQENTQVQISDLEAINTQFIGVQENKESNQQLLDQKEDIQIQEVQTPEIDENVQREKQIIQETYDDQYEENWDCEQVYNFQSEEIYIFWDQIEILKFHHAFYENIILNTIIQYDNLIILIERIIEQLINLLENTLKDNKLQTCFRKILSLIYLLCYNCKAQSHNSKNQNTLYLLEDFIQSGVNQIKQTKTHNNDKDLILKILEKIKYFLISPQFTPQQLSNYQFQIVINSPDQTMNIKKMDQLHYLQNINTKEHEIINSYQLLRRSQISDFVQIVDTKDNGYHTINLLKKLINYCIQANFLTYSQRKDLIILLTKICSLERQLDESNTKSEIERNSQEVMTIKSAILFWIQNKCKKEHQQFFQNYQDLMKYLK